MIFGHMPKDALPIQKGDVVEIPKGTMIHSTHPSRVKNFPAGRTYRVRVHDVTPGFDNRVSAYAFRKGHEVLRNPCVCWAGAGGYWMTADINDVRLPDSDRRIGEIYSHGERFVDIEWNSTRALYDGNRLVIAVDCSRGQAYRVLVEDEESIARQQAFLDATGWAGEFMTIPLVDEETLRRIVVSSA